MLRLLVPLAGAASRLPLHNGISTVPVSRSSGYASHFRPLRHSSGPPIRTGTKLRRFFVIPKRKTQKHPVIPTQARVVSRLAPPEAAAERESAGFCAKDSGHEPRSGKRGLWASSQALPPRKTQASLLLLFAFRTFAPDSGLKTGKLR